MASDPAKVEYADARVTIAVQRNLMVAHWRDAPLIPQLDAFEKAARRLAKSYEPAKCSVVNVAKGGTPDFSSEVREYVARIMKDRSLPILATAHIVLLPGLAGAAVRAFLSTTMLIAKPPGPAKVFGTSIEAAQWLQPRLATTAEAWTREQVMKELETAWPAP